MTTQRLVIWAIAALTIVFAVSGMLLEWPSPRLFAAWLLVVGAALVITETRNPSRGSQRGSAATRIAVMAVGLPVVALSALSLIVGWPSTPIVAWMLGILLAALLVNQAERRHRAGAGT